MSHEKFEIGEIAVFQHARYWPEGNGQEVQVTRGPENLPTQNRATGERWSEDGYYVAFGNGDLRFALPSQLRKRRPPQDWVKLCKLTDVPQEALCD